MSGLETTEATSVNLIVLPATEVRADDVQVITLFGSCRFCLELVSVVCRRLLPKPAFQRVSPG